MSVNSAMDVHVAEDSECRANLLVIAGGASAPRRRVRRKSWSRKIELLMLPLALCAGLCAAGSSAVSWWHTAVQPSSKMSNVARITVAPGDTLWNIAQRMNMVAQAPNDRIAAIRDLNPSISRDGSLKPGQTLVVPLNSTSTNPDLHLAQASEATTYQR